MDRSARSTEPNTLPRLHLLEGQVLAVHQGHAVLHSRKAATMIVAQHRTAFYEQHYAPRDSSWSSTALIDTIESATISTRGVQVIMLHRLLYEQSHPPGYGVAACPYCRLAPSDITSHLLRCYPQFYLQRLYLTWHILRHHRVAPLLRPRATTPLLIQGVAAWTPEVQVGLVSSLPEPPLAGPLPPRHAVLLSLTGKWHISGPDPRCPPLYASQRAEVTQAYHASLEQRPPGLHQVLAAAPVAWTPVPVELPDRVHVPHHAPPKDLSKSILLGSVLRRCANWNLDMA